MDLVSQTTYVGCNYLHKGQDLQFKDDFEKLFMIIFFISVQTYLIGHYNSSVGIIDLVSHTTYVVWVNFYTWLSEPAV